MQTSLCSICRSSSISFSTSRIAAKLSFSTLPTNRYAHHEEVRQSLRKVLGKDSKFSHSALKARGSLFTLKGPANESIPDIDVQKADKLDKLETCRAYNLQPRDLGTLDVDVPGTRRGQLFIRPGSIVYSVSKIRAVIRHDKMLLLEPLVEVREDEEVAADAASHSDNTQAQDKSDDISPYARIIQRDMRQIIVKDRLAQPEGDAKPTPFEFIALEALLEDTTAGLFDRSEELQTRFNNLLRLLTESETIPTAALQSMLELKDSGEEFKELASEFKSAIDLVLGEEVDMASMYLTDRANGKARELGNDDEVELLLETYRHHAYSLVTVASSVLSRLQSLNSHVTLLLSSTRNRLLNLEITIAVATLGMGVAAFIGALFGMNLTSGLEEAPGFFVYMTTFSLLCALVVVRLGRLALIRARRIKGDQNQLLKRNTMPIQHHSGK